MKLIICVLVLISYSSYGQIKINTVETKRNLVGEAKTFGSVKADLSFSIDGRDTVYTLVYNNMAYRITDLKQITFKGNETLEAFYKVLKSVFADENKKNKDYKIQFTLGNTEVVVSNFRAMGVTSALLTASGYVTLTEREVDKLFNKN